MILLKIPLKENVDIPPYIKRKLGGGGTCPCAMSGSIYMNCNYRKQKLPKHIYEKNKNFSGFLYTLLRERK